MLPFAEKLGDDRAGGADRPLEDLVGRETVLLLLHVVVDQGDRTTGAHDEAVDLAEPCGAARVHHHRVFDLLGAGLAQLELGEFELGVGHEAAHRRLLRAREEDLRTGEEPHRAHRRRKGIKIGREMGGDDLHALIVLNSRPTSESALRNPQCG